MTQAAVAHAVMDRAQPRTPAVHPDGRADAFLIRPRLTAMLDAGLERRVLLVTGPSGYGKTALIRSWLSAAGTTADCVMLTVRDDARPAVLRRHLLRAASTEGPVILAVEAVERLSRAALAELAELPAGMSGLHVVLVGREDPSPALPIRTAVGAARITAEDLRFTAEETHSLFRQLHVRLPRSYSTALAEVTQGWAVAVRHATEKLSRHAHPEALADRLLSGHELTDPLLERMLRDRPVDVQEFLVSTGVASRVWPELAVALSGREDADALLAELAREGVFVTDAAEGGRSYTIRPLARSVLATRLARRAPEEVGSLHRAAARWLAGAGHLTEAALHAAAGDDWTEAAGLLVDDLRVASLLVPHLDTALARSLAALPASAPGPEPEAVRAALALQRGDVTRCAAHVDAAIGLAERDPSERVASLRLWLALLELELAERRGDVRAGLTAADVVEELLRIHPPGLVRDRPELRALLTQARARLLFREGELAEASAVLAQAAQDCEVTGSRRCRLHHLAVLALVEAVRGRLTRAGAHAEAAQALAADLEVEPPPAVDGALAWVRMEEYDVAGARRHLRRALDARRRTGDTLMEGLLTLLRARATRADDDVEGALRLVDGVVAGEADPPLPAWVHRRLRAAAASMHVAAGRARALGADGHRGVPAEASLDEQVEALLAGAMRELSRGQARPARAALDRALRLAEPERLRRPFAEAPPRLRAFLADDSGLAARRQWLDRAVSGRDDEGSARPAVVEPLTDKEREVLEHMSALLSTEEIAQAMFISVNTVKSHVRSILRKLSATRRNEAVRRARELDLIAPWPGPGH